ncbi:arginine--tRNA ligase [Ruminococcus albus]|uniref:Arginine--tRNA ligase n=1 Tax=Ruminococcus albus 8 TaxID=246199 RepID=E9SAW4_RUMAL|nr:arginine--tRNA ligase [Ruminococcus albus]EGC03729.1 arginine--tRNA ligase [Ruminococcus albus 8]MCC3349932.1 arginine--tRNA ligase [Ruminococcus albus 8]
MYDLINESFTQARELVMNAMGALVAEGVFPAEAVPAFNIEIPADSKNGDVSTNAAMVCAKPFRNAPRKIAEAIVGKIVTEGSCFEKVEIAGPGFINFFYNKGWYASVVKAVLDAGADYGKTEFGKGKRALVEFVSANPTGPMHIGNARGGAIGDCLAAVMEYAGYEVEREFYINDAGNQIEKFGKSLRLRYMQICSEAGQAIVAKNLDLDAFCKEIYGEDGNRPEFPMPDDVYLGMDIIAHAKNFFDEYGMIASAQPEEDCKKALVDYALPKNIQGLHDDLAKYRIEYDTWFRESTLHNDGSVAKVIEQLKASGYTYEQDGALWFKTTEFGDEKDRVLVRDNGIPTYFVPDIAYHYNKLAERKFDKAIDIFGADHHGYIPRLKAAMTALGVDAKKLDIVIMQMVRLVKNGETYKLSKRSGKAITLNTLLEEIPIDAARFFFNLREPNSQFDFDLDLAISNSSQNPVYYVQYAHARICSVIKKLKEEGVEAKAFTDEMAEALNTSEELELVKLMATLPTTINDAAKAYDPAKVTKYAVDIATLYHKFYNACRIKGEPENVMQARLSLSLAVKQIIANILGMLKINCPESM